MVKVSFYGGAQEVTGSCFLFDSGSTKILIDCGLFQCPKFCDIRSEESFLFSPSEIAALFVTHAHIDHTGRIPKLVRDGFAGKIFSTHPTRELSELMLRDSLGVLAKEASRENRQTFYSDEDISRAMEMWKGAEYREEITVGDMKIVLRDSGHVLGSAMIDISWGNGRRAVFTGDIGNPPTPLLNDPEEVPDADFLLVESTYGSRVHEDRALRKLKLERFIEDIVRGGGAIMIPAFSLERTQELLFEINDLVEAGRIPAVPVFLDSPLAISATAIYKKYERYFNKEANARITSGDDLFHFPLLKMTRTTEESKRINDVPAPKIIIAGSGMSTGGRILHHERRYLPDPRSALLMVGYQAPGSLGRILQDGADKVTIFGERIEVRARIETLSGYSAHPDREQLLNFIAKGRGRLEKVFAIQGEPASALFLVQRVRDYLGVKAYAPSYGESYEL